MAERLDTVNENDNDNNNNDDDDDDDSKERKEPVVLQLTACPSSD